MTGPNVATRLYARRQRIRLIEVRSRQLCNFNHFAREALQGPSHHALIIDDVEIIAQSHKYEDTEK
ncbi:hypothetical protein ColLi_06172 [Colletotrichum liriopes]|uniref:Uncharacterized protein n=1 Tax=Colletotrichum liriopes TaxID=708192 RepID=A0AA37LSK0_9PEZI|nr:hypothetical protein ColLi_06172 [Colletotrichum liriopes]